MTVAGERGSPPPRLGFTGAAAERRCARDRSACSPTSCRGSKSARTRSARAGLFPFEPSEIWLEIGFGSGEHLIDQAKANPGVGFVGCEPFLNGVAAALAGIERESLANVRLRRGDARALVEFGAGRVLLSRLRPLSRPMAEAAAPQAPRHFGGDDHGAGAGDAARAPSCASRPTSTTTPAGRCGGFWLRLTSAGRLRAPRIGGPTGLNGVRRAMKPRRTGRAGDLFTLLSFGCEPMSDANAGSPERENHATRRIASKGSSCRRALIVGPFSKGSPQPRRR